MDSLSAIGEARLRETAPEAEGVLRAAANLRHPTIVDAYNEEPLRVAMGHLGQSFRPGASVLDLGCGAGRLTRALAESGLRAFGVDVDGTCVAAARAQRHAGRAHYAVAEGVGTAWPAGGRYRLARGARKPRAKSS